LWKLGGLTRRPLRIQISCVWQISTDGSTATSAHCAASLPGSQASSESRKAIQAPELRATPVLRAAATPRFGAEP